jgi:nucleoside-diphosphate-sugar epimerase
MLDPIMKTLVTGAQGYVGSLVMAHMTQLTEVQGLDIGLFKSVSFEEVPNQFNIVKKDIRDIKLEDLRGFDNLVHLAAISNDPMGEKFSKATNDINFFSTVNLASLAKKAGISKFIFASSASVYGSTNQEICDEGSDLNPLTTYAVSKRKSEIKLEDISDDNFKVICFRFATACGYSPRLRLDLVLNDFIYQALSSNKISLNSSGNAFRPLIDTKDMVTAINWAIKINPPSNFEIVNTGFDSWNFKIIELAELVSSLIPNTAIKINKHNPDDKRSYRLDFSKANRLGIFNKIPDITDTILILKSKLEFFLDSKIDLKIDNFKRLSYLNHLIANNIIDDDLKFR